MLTIGLGPAFASGGGGGGGQLAVFKLEGANVNVTFKGSSIEEFPYVDTSLITDATDMFKSCELMVSVPNIDTSSVISMNSMFSECKSLKVAPKMDMSKVIQCSSMFYNCSALEEIPQYDVSKLEYMSQMFLGCKSLKNIPSLNTSECSNMSGAFRGCISLETILGLDMTNVSSNSYTANMFQNCQSLRDLYIVGLKEQISLSDSPLLSKESVLYLFDNAQTVTTAKPIKLHADVFAQLTEDEIAIATEKGFSVVSA